MKKRLYLLLLPLALYSCSSESDKPADLVPEAKMAQILTDVHVAEAAIGRTIQNFDTSKVAYKQAHKLILKRYNVSDSAFKHSYDYYLTNPAVLDKVYQTVLDSLSQRQAKMTPKELVDSAALDTKIEPGLEEVKE